MNLPRETLALAEMLLGCVLHRETSRGVLKGEIIETEAYTRDDPASHSFRGRTRRNGSMFLPPFHAYIYLCYGIHHCLNITSAEEGIGEAVLIRSLKPLKGLDLMAENREGPFRKGLLEGPGNLCAALAVDMSLDGHDLARPPLLLVVPPDHRLREAERMPRVGISRGRDKPWRFRMKNTATVPGAGTEHAGTGGVRP